MVEGRGDWIGEEGFEMGIEGSIEWGNGLVESQ